MKDKNEVPASLKIKMNLGAIILGAANLLMVFADGYFLPAAILGIVGATILFTAIKQAKNKKYTTISDKQKKNRFVLISGATLLGLFGGPFITPEQPGVYLEMKLVISLILAPILIAFIYWLMFKKFPDTAEGKRTP